MTTVPGKGGERSFCRDRSEKKAGRKPCLFGKQEDYFFSSFFASFFTSFFGSSFFGSSFFAAFGSFYLG